MAEAAGRYTIVYDEGHLAADPNWLLYGELQRSKKSGVFLRSQSPVFGGAPQKKVEICSEKAQLNCVIYKTDI